MLVMQEDGCVISQRSAHVAEASTSRAALPASDVVVAHPEQGRGHAGVPPAHFDETQAVTLVFRKKTKCKPICMSGSSFMHIVTYK
jgi:hypothetical protein